jgi:hypothetical protein
VSSLGVATKARLHTRGYRTPATARRLRLIAQRHYSSRAFPVLQNARKHRLFVDDDPGSHHLPFQDRPGAGQQSGCRLAEAAVDSGQGPQPRPPSVLPILFFYDFIVSGARVFWWRHRNWLTLLLIEDMQRTPLLKMGGRSNTTSPSNLSPQTEITSTGRSRQDRSQHTGHDKHDKVTTTWEERAVTCNTPGLPVLTHIGAGYWQLAVSFLSPNPQHLTYTLQKKLSHTELSLLHHISGLYNSLHRHGLGKCTAWANLMPL